MKIVFITPRLANGGAEREAVAYADALAEMGNEVHIRDAEMATER